MSITNSTSKMFLAIFMLVLLFITTPDLRKASAAPFPQSSDITVDIRLEEGGVIIAPGETAVIEIEVINTGRSEIDAVTVKAVFDPVSTRVSLVQVNNGRGWMDSSPLGEQGELIWDGISLSANQSWRGRYTVTIAQPVQFDNVVVSQDNSLLKLMVNQVSVLVNGSEAGKNALELGIPIGMDALQVAKENVTGSGLGPSGEARLTLSIKSKADDLIFTNLRVVESFKAELAPPKVRGLEIIDSSQVQGNPQYEIIDDQIIWRVDRIAPGGEWYVTYQVKINPSFDAGNKEISNSAVTLMQSDAGEIPVAQADSLAIPVSIPKFSLSREIVSENQNEEFRPGDFVTYKLTYTNQGTGMASQVVIIESIDPQVLEGQFEINNDGQQKGNTIEWQLGDVPVGVVGEVSYVAQIKSDLYAIDTGLNENHSISSSAILRAEGIPDTDEANRQVAVIRAPVLRLTALKAEDLNGGETLPGDTIRVTIDVGNGGAVAASSIVVRGIYDKNVAILRELSDGGISGDGFVEWRTDELPPAANRRVSYDLLINTEPEQTVESKIEAVVSLAGADVARSSRSVTIQPRPLPTATPDPSANQMEASVFEQKNFEWMAILIGGLAVSSLLVVSYQAWSLKEKHHFDTHFRDIVEMFTIIIIVVAVLILAMVSEIGSTPAVGVLSGIAGYVLGRGARR